MKKEILNIQDKFVLIVEKVTSGFYKNMFDVVYSVDDSQVLWIHQKGGASRGSRFACISNDTFFESAEKAQQGLNYLNGCFFTWTKNIKIVQVKELKNMCIFTYDLLINDVDDNNESVIAEKLRVKIERQEILKQSMKTIESLRTGEILNYEKAQDEDEENVYIVKIKIK